MNTLNFCKELCMNMIIVLVTIRLFSLSVLTSPAYYGVADSGSEEYPRSHPEACGEAEPGDVDPGERSAGGNPGWADAMAKVLRTNKPKRKRSVVLSKARRIQDVGSEKLLMDPGFQIDGDGETGVDTHLEPRKRKVCHSFSPLLAVLIVLSTASNKTTVFCQRTNFGGVSCFLRVSEICL